MDHDEQAIRDLVTRWLEATQRGDLATVLSLMSDDVVFMVPGREPFGKEAFASASQGMQGVLIEGTSDILEVKVLGDWAWMRTRLRVVMTPADGKPLARSGYTLTILRKNQSGSWVTRTLRTPKSA